MKKLGAFAKFGVLAAIAIMLWIVPDPIPFVDEILFTLLALYEGRKVI